MEGVSAKGFIKNSLYKIHPCKQDCKWANIIPLVFSLIISILLVCSNNISGNFSATLEQLLTLQLAIFGVVFTIYSIILAFLTDEYLKQLAGIPNNGEKKSFLFENITYYEFILYLYFMNLIVTGIVLLININLSDNFRLTSFLDINIQENIGLEWCFFLDKLFAFLFFVLYLWYSFRGFYELKSTIYNTILLFRGRMMYRFLAFINEDDEKV